MRRLWSEAHKRRLWRRIWVALAEAEQAAGLVTAEQVADLRAHQEDVDLARAQEIEAEIHHDLMAEVRTYAEQCPVGGGIIHLGATSMDIEDNADALRHPGGARPGAGQAAQAAAGLRRPDRGLGRCADHGLHPPPARRADHGGLPAGAVRPRPAGRLRRAAPRPRRHPRQGVQGRGRDVGVVCAVAQWKSHSERHGRREFVNQPRQRRISSTPPRSFAGRSPHRNRIVRLAQDDR